MVDHLEDPDYRAGFSTAYDTSFRVSADSEKPFMWRVGWNDCDIALSMQPGEATNIRQLIWNKYGE